MGKYLELALMFIKRRLAQLVKNFMAREIHEGIDHIKEDLHVKSHEELANDINATLAKHLGDKAQLTQEEMASLSNDLLTEVPDVDKVIDDVIAKIVARIQTI